MAVTDLTISTLSTTLPKPACSIACATVGTKIYLFGGESNRAFLNTINVFDTASNAITTLPVTLPYKEAYIACAAVGTKIYLFGGSAYSNAIKVFDTELNTITTLSTTLSVGESKIACAAVGTKIYLFGGTTYDDGEAMEFAFDEIKVFDTISNTITRLSVSLPKPTSNIACATVGTKIYLFGGLSDYPGISKTINVFDTTSNTLTTLSTTLPNGVYNIAIATIDTRIYLFGGSLTNTISMFDTELDTITTLSITLPKAMDSTAAAFGTKIYLFGGNIGSSPYILDTILLLQASAPKVSVDLTTLPGWSSLSTGSHNITIVAKADGYRDSEPSAAVTVEKAPAVVMPIKGDIITLDSKQYRVLKTEGTVAEVLTMYDASTSQKFDTNSSYNNTYAGKNIDTYCNNTFYSGLSAAMKSAIVDKTFAQDSWTWGSSVPTPSHYTGKYSVTNYYLTLANAAYGSSITRHCYCLSVQDVLDYLDATTSMGTSDTTLTETNIWQMFWNTTSSQSGKNIWLHSASSSSTRSVFYVYGLSGYLDYGTADDSRAVRPAFQIDLSKIDWTKASTLISFTIAGTSYQAEEGMTWEEWVNSSYNTGGYYVDGTAIMTPEKYMVVANLSSTINDGNNYSINTGEGGGSGN